MPILDCRVEIYSLRPNVSMERALSRLVRHIQLLACDLVGDNTPSVQDIALKVSESGHYVSYPLLHEEYEHLCNLLQPKFRILIFLTLKKEKFPLTDSFSARRNSFPGGNLECRLRLEKICTL